MKTQEELSRELVGGPYVNPETGIAEGSLPGPDTQRNRESQISRADDNAQSIHVGIYDIDLAINYYFNNVILPNVKVNGNTLTVPVIYGNPEKWQAVQKEGYLRDKNGRKQVPVIVLKRDSLEKNRNITSKVDANNPHNFYISAKTYTARNQYDNFHKIPKELERSPEQALLVTVVPDYVKVQYSCIILTDTMVQMNSILESLVFASDSYWGDPNRFKFQSFIDSFRTEIQAGDGEDRTVKTEFTIKLNGYILPNTVNSSPYTNLKRYKYTHKSIKFTERES